MNLWTAITILLRSQILNQHAPLPAKVIKSRPLVPWFNENVKAARREKRKAERKWCRTGNAENMTSYKIIKNNTNKHMSKARCQFYKNFMDENNSNQVICGSE